MHIRNDRVRLVTGAFTIAALCLAAPASAEAQSPAAVSQGTKSLSFGIDGSGGSEAGIWVFVTERANLGLLGTLDWSSEERSGPPPDLTRLTIRLGPAIKWYLLRSPDVAPFWFGRLGFSHTRASEDGESVGTSHGLALHGGFGVDWFPVDQMSVGGWTGLRFANERDPDDDSTTTLRTFTTGLRVHLYF